jgi:hypothetical protein
MTPCPLEKFWTAFPLILSMPLIFMDHMWRKQFFYFDNPGCPGQLTRTTTNPRIHWTLCKPSRQVRHRGDNKHACWDLNPGCRGREFFNGPDVTCLRYYSDTLEDSVHICELSMNPSWMAHSIQQCCLFFSVSTLLIINFVILY